MKYLLVGSLLAVATGCGALGTALADAKPALYRPSGMPSNALVAFDAYKKESDSTLLVRALNLYHWDWNVQIPDDARTFVTRISVVDTKTNVDKEIAAFKVWTTRQPIDPLTAERLPPPRYFPVRLILFPAQNDLERPITMSEKWVLCFERTPPAVSGASSSDLRRKVIPNPFRGAGNVGIMHTSLIASPLPPAPGMWDGFGTAFDILSADSDSGSPVTVRVTFSAK